MTDQVKVDGRKQNQRFGPTSKFQKDGPCLHYRPDSQALGFLARAAFDLAKAEFPLLATA